MAEARSLFLPLLAILLPQNTARAQENTDDDSAVVAEDMLPATSQSLAPRTDDGRQIYDAALFERFAPQTAEEMVRQIPGFTILESSGDRGLGEASQNVLINGQRISGKSNDARTVLGRTPAASVVRIEIVDGATLDIPGLSGQVLNLVTSNTGLNGSFNWQPQFREGRIPPNWFRGDISLSGKIGKGDFTVSLSNDDSFRGGGWGPEFATDAGGNPLFTREFDSLFIGDRPTLSGSYSRTSDGGSVLNLNGEFQFFRFRRDSIRDVTGADIPDTAELSTGREDEWNFEVSGDYEFDAAGGRLKLIGYHRFERSPTESLFRQDFADASPPEASRFIRDADEGESILRAEYGWKSGTADWRISAEGAYNFLDVESELLELDGQGMFQPEPLDNATARVSEKRGEVILSWGRPLSPTLSVQAQIGGEYSELTQTGANGLKRQFVRPKGQMSFAWKPTSRFDLNGKFERSVGQLNFFDFLASVDLQDANDNAGNPDLVPPQSWLAEMQINRNFGAVGSASVTLQYEKFTDIVDQTPILGGGEAPGNLPDSASRWSAEANVTFLLDPIGFKGAKLDLEGFYQDSSLTDPVTGLRRRFGGQRKWTWELDFRHDIPGSKLAWGFGAEDRRDATFFRLDFSELEKNTKPDNYIFVEHKDIFGLKLRATLINLLNQRERTTEIFFADRLNGVIDERRERLISFGRIFRISISGSF